MTDMNIPAPGYGYSTDGSRGAAPPRSVFFTAYDGHPPWDVGHPQPRIAELADEGILDGRVLDVGCGTGEHTLMAAGRGHPAVGVDLVPAAIDKARAKAAERGFESGFAVADVLEPGSIEGPFDTIIDSGVFHVFDDDDRNRYVTRLRELLTPGGQLLLMCFSDAQAGQEGPRRVSESELRAAFAEGWRVRSLEAARFESTMHPGGARAWLAVISKV